jgi:hypothetical protein
MTSPSTHEVNGSNTEILNDDPFTDLVAVCSDRLVSQNWERPHGSYLEEDTYVRIFYATRGKILYQLTQFGKAKGEAIEPAQFLAVKVSNLDPASSETLETYGTFDIDPINHQLSSIGISPKMLKVFGDTPEAQTGHLLDVMANSQESLESLASRALDKKNEFYLRLWRANLLKMAKSGALVVCFQATDDPNRIVGLRFKDDHTRIEYAYVDEAGKKVMEHISLDVGGARVNISTNGTLRVPMSPQAAMHYTVELIHTLKEDFNRGSFQPYVPGSGRNGFVALDLIDYAANTSNNTLAEA